MTTDVKKIPASISRRILTIGEAFRDRNAGGIVSVIRTYADCFEVFRFVASSRERNILDKIIYDLGGFFKMLFSLRGVKIVHIHTAAGGSFGKHMIYACAAKLLGRKVIMHIHGSRFKEYWAESPLHRKSRILRSLRKADAVIVLSRSWQEWFRSIGVDGTIVLNNIIPYPSASSEAPQNDGLLHMLFLGEIGERKGVFDLLKGIYDHADEFQDRIHLAIGGSGDEARMRKKISSFAIAEMVSYEGFVSGEKKASLLREAQAYILPSYHEGLPISILEAMSYGCAIISTPVGGIPEIVGSDNGLLVPPGDTEAIAEAIRTLIHMQDEGSLESLGQRSREKVAPFFPDAVLDSLEKIYEALFQEGAQS